MKEKGSKSSPVAFFKKLANYITRKRGREGEGIYESRRPITLNLPYNEKKERTVSPRRVLENNVEGKAKRDVRSGTWPSCKKEPSTIMNKREGEGRR